MATKKTSRRSSPQKRIRRTREEGMSLLLSAADELLKDHHPDDVGVREIGERANVHHRFVAEWFGGKVALFREVHNRRAAILATEISEASSFQDRSIGRALESVRHEIILVNWLIQSGSHFENLEEAFPALESARIFLETTMGLSNKSASKSVQVIGSLVVADALLRDHMEIKFSLFDLIVHHLEAVSPNAD